MKSLLLILYTLLFLGKNTEAFPVKDFISFKANHSQVPQANQHDDNSDYTLSESEEEWSDEATGYVQEDFLPVWVIDSLIALLDINTPADRGFWPGYHTCLVQDNLYLAVHNLRI